MKQVTVIGAGFSGLSAATCLAAEGFDVTVVEKHQIPGGRARQFSSEGFTFDMGPSWYWMPDVFERYFNRFGKKVSDYYQLKRLDPSYRIYYGKNDCMDIPASLENLYELFEKLEPGSSKNLARFLKDGKFKYETGINKLVYKPGLRISELVDWDVIKGSFRLQLLSSLTTYIKGLFKSPRIIQLLEFPVLFLGATPQKTPALYSLMNYADIVLGTWYPVGGMYNVVKGMKKLAEETGVKFKFDSPVSSIEMNGKGIKNLQIKEGAITSDYVVASADYQFVDQHLLPPSHRKYSTNIGITGRWLLLH